MADSTLPERRLTWRRYMLRLAAGHPIQQHASLASAFVLVAGYAYLLAWFSHVDFYHNDFFAHGRQVTGYQMARLLFIFYFAWTIYCAGACANFLLFGRTSAPRIPACERSCLFFITGAGIWLIAMFVIGLAGFDIKPVAVALSLGTMALSTPHLAACLARTGNVTRSAHFDFTTKTFLAAILWLGIAVVGALFVFQKGLYPGGGHDYYNHYFQFYKRVIETGSILPNDVWYHFYYSKGAGLYFLGMLLTDPLAPQLVTTGFMACGACIVYALLRSSTRSTLLPLVGVLLYFGAFIYTPGPRENMLEGGWGILEKTHELTAVLLLAVTWIAYRLFRSDVEATGPWTLGLHAAVVSIALLTLPLALLVGLYLTGYLVWFAATGQWRVARRPFAGGVTAAFSILAMLGINYYCTGLPSDQLVLQFWPYANLTTISRWGTMAEVLRLHEDMTGMLQNQEPISWQTVPLLATFLRLELWWPLFLAAAPGIILRATSKAGRNGMLHSLNVPAVGALAWLAVTTIPAAVFGGGLSQPISFYRLATFSYAPTMCLALLLCHLALAAQPGRKLGTRLLNLVRPTSFAATLGMVAIFNISTIEMVRQHLTAILSNAASLSTGRFSLEDAYQNQQGWSGFPWGAIYPGIIEPWRIVGRGTRIWSFQIHSYCMLPDCNLQETVSNRMSRVWQVVLFGPPEQGIDALKAEGLNYFFFSTELAMGHDQLPASPIFAPSEIAKHLAVRWSDGTNYLLTWPDKNTHPIDRKFLAVYRAAVENDGTVDRIVNDHWKQISHYITRHKDHLYPFFLPWCITCRNMPPIDWASTQ